MNQAFPQFLDAMRAAGLEPPGAIEPGRLYRFPGAGKRDGNTAGWCKLFDDGLGGCFGDWSSGLSENWQAKRDKPFSPAEWEAFKRHVAETQAQAEVERKARQADAAAKAAKIWDRATPAPADHPYLVRKRIQGYGVRLHNGGLVIPMRDGDELHSLQFISPDGEKRFLSGGCVTGCTYIIGNAKGATAMCIAEGFATGATIHEATGYPVAVAFNAGNLGPVALALRKQFPKLTLAVCGDDDHRTEGNPGKVKATEAARAVGGIAVFPKWSDVVGDRTDFNDLAASEGIDCVRVIVQEAIAKTADDDDDGTIRRMASLSEIEYEKCRKAEAEKMGIRATVLDKLVQSNRRESQSAVSDFNDVAPWESAVNPSKLLDNIAGTVRRFIVCEDETVNAVALWAAMTWFMDVVLVAPLAVITAPEKRCGKSQLLFLLGRLVRRPLAASNISPAALFRSIDAWKPTLLVDEADAFMRDNEELRGLLNCGHTRDSAYIVRVVGDDHIPTKFNVWGAKALAGIGHLADTLMDRSIALELRRKLPHECVDRLRHAEPELFDDLARKLARFAIDHSDSVRASRPELPARLNDRAQDNWEPLLAIADVAGGEWPTLARRAALKLSGSEDAALTVGTELLSDIQEIFERKRVDRISSADLITELCGDDEKPWATYNRGKPISPRQVSSRLREYGIHSKQIRFGYDDTRKGYIKESFAESFTRYLGLPPLSTETPKQSSNITSLGVSHAKRCFETVSDEETGRSLTNKECFGVSDTQEGQARREVGEI